MSGTESATGGCSMRVTALYTLRVAAPPWQEAASATSGARHAVRTACNWVGAPMTGRACGMDSEFIVTQVQ